MTADLTNPVFTDEDKAREWLEAHRWPNGPFCGYCGQYDTVTPFSGKSMGPGWYHCNSCRKKFTVRVGTLYERSHIPLHKWLLATHLLTSSKKGISAHQLHRMLGITYKTAWFMAHRIRFAMGEGPLAHLLDGEIEIDETYIGGKPRHGDPKPKGGYRKNSRKVPVVALVQRGGKVRTQVTPKVNGKNLKQFIDANLHKSASIQTDESALYKNKFFGFDGGHSTVNHKDKEFARHNEDGSCDHVNTAESFFSLLKRGVIGAFHHVSPEHLHRYATEFSFRWNHRKFEDGERLSAAVEMAEGKRLTYRQVV